MTSLPGHLPDRADRGWQLLRSNRADLAAREFRAALADAPDDPRSLSGLAVSLSILDEDREARDVARSAIRAAPDLALAHAVLASSELALGRPKEAIVAIDEAIRLEPDVSRYHGIRAQNLIALNRRKEALAAAEHGLALDPEDEACLSVRSMALVRLNRAADAVEGARRSLALEPNSPYAHATLGHTLLLQGKAKEAAGHFREALRLKPDHALAREGLLHSLRARFVVYRAFLWWMSFCARMPSRVVAIAILAIFFLPRLLGQVAATYPALDGAILGVRIALAVFVVLTWAAVPIFNGLLLLTRDGRLLLRPMERFWASATLLAIASSLLFVATWLAMGSAWEGAAICIRGALASAILLIPLGAASTHSDSPPLPRWFTRAAAVAFAGLFAYWTVTGLAGWVFLGLVPFWVLLMLPPFSRRA